MPVKKDVEVLSHFEEQRLRESGLPIPVFTPIPVNKRVYEVECSLFKERESKPGFQAEIEGLKRPPIVFECDEWGFLMESKPQAMGVRVRGFIAGLKRKVEQSFPWERSRKGRFSPSWLSLHRRGVHTV